jgi:hypothetical protein
MNPYGNLRRIFEIFRSTPTGLAAHTCATLPSVAGMPPRSGLL